MLIEFIPFYGTMSQHCTYNFQTYIHILFFTNLDRNLYVCMWCVPLQFYKTQSDFGNLQIAFELPFTHFHMLFLLCARLPHLPLAFFKFYGNEDKIK